MYTNAAGQYLVFGERKLEDMSRSTQALASQNFQNAGFNLNNLQTEAQKKKSDAPAAPATAEDDDEEVDASGVEAKDIELVMQQANVSKSKAVAALRKNNFDIVNAIMVSFISHHWWFAITSRQQVLPQELTL